MFLSLNVLVFCVDSTLANVCLHQSLPEAVGLSDKFKNVSLVREPVKEGCRHGLVPKNGIPVTKSKVGCEDDGNSLIQVRAKLEQALRPFCAKRDEADFCCNDQRKEGSSLG